MAAHAMATRATRWLFVHLIIPKLPVEGYRDGGSRLIGGYVRFSRSTSLQRGIRGAARPATWVPFRTILPRRASCIRGEGTPAVRLIYAGRGARGAGVSRGPMQTDVETLPEDRVRLTVEVPAHDVDHAFEHALRDLAKDVRIPGFRKGKVPAKVVLARLGPEAVTEEALRTHLGSWYARAVTQARIEPVDQPDIDWSDPPQEGAPFAFTATVQVAPGADAAGRPRARGAARGGRDPGGRGRRRARAPAPGRGRARAAARRHARGARPLRAHRLHRHARRQGAEGRERHRLQRRGRRGPPRRRARAGAARHAGRRDASRSTSPSRPTTSRARSPAAPRSSTCT